MPLTLSALLLAASAFAATAPNAPKEVTFKTGDGWTIAAVYRAPEKGKPVVVLAHGVASSKGEWGKLTDALAEKGVGTLALDLRGHYQSKKGPGGERGYETFTPADWNSAVEDLLAAARWLEAKGVPAKRIGLGGASIGANLAAQAASRRPKTPFLILLSAGLDYRGVALTFPKVKTIAAAAPSDGPAEDALPPLARAGAETLMAQGGHGTQMFDDPAVVPKLADWVLAAARPPRTP